MVSNVKVDNKKTRTLTGHNTITLAAVSPDRLVNYKCELTNSTQLTSVSNLNSDEINVRPVNTNLMARTRSLANRDLNT